MNSSDHSTNDKLVRVLGRSRRVAVLTGAGISAESGIPTFRDAQTGLWARFRAEDLATPAAFNRDPKLIWEWYAWRRSLILHASPNGGHEALAAMENRFARFTLVTQNIDGLHRRAGSRHIVELHGNIHRARCREENIVLDSGWDWSPLPPRCPRCGGPLRPDVVWFGEPLPPDALRAAETAAAECDVLFSVGTSSLVYPAAELPFAAKSAGATVIEVNPVETPLTPYAHYSLRGPAGAILPRLLHRL